ncbi:MAG: Rpn family recombination-promoting nuclease/putative transposase [Fibromonadaceae bacterium]|jgi:predicted transposase YdaD|nr:Rpn family recombination-promoting nuclease/putative transposase [Fibromonadaceae bacterium]
MTEAKTNRNHKDSVFTRLFSEKSNLLELYSAISGKSYPESTKIEIVTLSDVLYMNQINDIAFVMEDRLIVLIEHQSSVNNNMPLRMLRYLSAEYDMIVDRKNLYKQKRIMVPSPEFIVLYNGDKKFPDYKELKLSDSFKSKTSDLYLELVVRIYNINKGHNVDMAGKSPVLSGYEEFIAQIKENLKSMELREAIKLAVKTCISKKILVSFLERHSSEVENMIFGEWNMDEAKQVWYEEGKEEGMEEGMQNVFSLLEQGVSIAEAKEILLKQTRPATA